MKSQEILRRLATQFVVGALSFGAGRTGYCYTTMPLHITLCLSERSWQINSSPFCHVLHIHLSLDLEPCDFFCLSSLEREATWASTSVCRGDCHCRKGKRKEPSCKRLPAATPTLADLHSGQQLLF
jgi:hypothetical protein